MRKRRNGHRGLVGRAARIAGSLILWLLAKAARRPVDSCALLAAVAVSLLIIVNAVFLQPGSRHGPFFANPPLSPVPAVQSSALPRPWPLRNSVGGAPAWRPVAAPRNDPIAELIGLSSRIMAVQRILSDHDYGQLKPTGILDEPTRAAIEKFEREHKLPVTGRISGRLLGKLADMPGHPLQ